MGTTTEQRDVIKEADRIIEAIRARYSRSLQSSRPIVRKGRNTREVVPGDTAEDAYDRAMSII